MLERFRQAKQREIERLRVAPPADPWPHARCDFAAAISSSRRHPAIIAEYKRASPSRGTIRTDLTAENVAGQYARAGAVAMSVLTEEQFFQGHLAHLTLAHQGSGGQLPLLRKDFIIDALQVMATAATPASALLLIARMFADVGTLRAMRELAESYGMAAVVEIFDQRDLALARDSGARIIQVNARDLNTLKVSREACLTLIGEARPTAPEVWICASGMNESAHLAQAADAGYDAVLVGTALMAAPSPGIALSQLLEGISHAT